MGERESTQYKKAHQVSDAAFCRFTTYCDVRQRLRMSSRAAGLRKHGLAVGISLLYLIYQPRYAY